MCLFHVFLSCKLGNCIAFLHMYLQFEIFIFPLFTSHANLLAVTFEEANVRQYKNEKHCSCGYLLVDWRKIYFLEVRTENFHIFFCCVGAVLFHDVSFVSHIRFAELKCCRTPKSWYLWNLRTENVEYLTWVDVINYQ